MSSVPLLQVDDLQAHLVTRRGTVRAVDGVSFTVAEGETLGLVGESGCGKTMTALSIMRMLPRPAGRIVGGRVSFAGQDLVSRPEKEMRGIRGKLMAMVLQDPMSSLNPVFTVGTQIAEPIHTHHRPSASELRAQVLDLLGLVRIPSPRTRVNDYPHQMSGGMRQRIVGAIALAGRPRLLVADEPTTALDVTIQAQYLKLLEDLQAELGLAIVVITHDFGVVARLCDRVAVMYAGRIVETADVRSLFDRPAHPYTQALLASLPDAIPPGGRLQVIEGQPPDLRDPGPGCRFAPRCPQARDLCRRAYPGPVAVATGHTVQCWAVTGFGEP